MYNILYNTNALNEKGTKQQNMLQCWKELYFVAETMKEAPQIKKVCIVF
jgi:hypothetical protein